MANDVERSGNVHHEDDGRPQHDARQSGDEQTRAPMTQDLREPAHVPSVQQVAVAEDDDTKDHKQDRYDYSKLDSEVATRARESAEKINLWHRNAIIRSGNELRERKKEIAHGEFMKWCSEAMNFSQATVRNYMAAAREFSGVPLIVSVLPRTVIYRLAGAGEDVRSVVIARVKAGEVIDPDEVRDLIVKGRAETERLKSPEKMAKKEKAEKRRLKREAKEQRKYEQMLEEVRCKEAVAIDEAISIFRRWDVDEDELFKVMGILSRISPAKVRTRLAETASSS